MRGISKTFPGVRALDDVSLSVEAGTVHVLLGQNGAGKSTLMRILCGAQHPAGRFCHRRPAQSPADARRLGVAGIIQK
jgi:ribose transport system ATP-binding protein